MNSRYNIKKHNLTTKNSIYFNPESNNSLKDIEILLEDDIQEENSYKTVTDNIFRIIHKNGFLCKGLNPEYIFKSIGNVDAVVTIRSSLHNETLHNETLHNVNILSFAFIIFDEKHNAMYVDIICSHNYIQGAGDILMNELEQICKKLSMTTIFLKSVKSAISFYEKYGYIKQDVSCDNMCVMKKKLTTNSGGNKKTPRTKKDKKGQKGQKRTNRTKKNKIHKNY